jgi:Muskelin N-terminus
LNNMTELLHAGLRNDSEAETFQLRYTANGVVLSRSLLSVFRKFLVDISKFALYWLGAQISILAFGLLNFEEYQTPVLFLLPFQNLPV